MNLQLMLKLLHTLEQLRQHERWARPQLLAYQAETLHRQREYVYAHSPFYQRFHKGLFERPLSELPVLTKTMMMEQFDDLVTDRQIRLETVRGYTAKNAGNTRYLGRYWVTATSGSSGQPGFFLFSEPEWIMIMASFARAQEWSGARVNLLRRRKMATVASISPWHMSSQVAATAQTWWTPSLRIAASELLETIVQRLNDWQPQMLIAYASMARILAEEQLAGRLHIHPEKVYTSSEVLTDETRRRIKTAWGDEPYNQYASTETASIAAECESGRRLHLFEDLVIVEVVDEQYRLVPPGEYGTKLLITTLFSRTQPLIRYELNDSVRLTAEACSCGNLESCSCAICNCVKVERCTCGRPFALLESVQGRMEDTLLLPAAAGGRVAVPPLVFNHIMDILPVSGWQVIQEADDSLTVLLSSGQDGQAGQALAAQLRQTLASHGAEVPHITIQLVEMIPKTAAGKAPLIKAYQPSRSG